MLADHVWCRFARKTRLTSKPANLNTLIAEFGEILEKAVGPQLEVQLDLRSRINGSGFGVPRSPRQRMFPSSGDAFMLQSSGCSDQVKSDRNDGRASRPRLLPIEVNRRSWRVP